MFNRFKKMKYFIRVVIQLGIYNVLSVILYRLMIKSRLLALIMPGGHAYQGEIFPKQSEFEPVENWAYDKESITHDADRLIRDHQIAYFSRHILSVGSPPSWFCNPFNSQVMRDANLHFSIIGDFNNSIGDIKTVWEASRFDWAPLLARAARLTGNKKYIEAINFYVGDWIKNNPYCIGPNWKCGQETSIRMLNLLLSAYILRQHKEPSEVFIRFIYEHCRRIRPTIYYAVAQDNNHGTSEAAALFVGGAWLAQYAAFQPEAASRTIRWCQYGRQCLEERIRKLVEEDGSFSQKSLNYHRVLVDTLNLAEFWRRTLGQPLFSDEFYRKARKSVEWLYWMTDEESGDGPNLGANDGARFIQLSSTTYRDYRSSVQLGSAIFFKGIAYPAGAWDEPLSWLDLQNDNSGKKLFKKESRLFDNGGYVILCGGKSQQKNMWGMLHFPRFNKRPSHADIFHFDLWYNGENILRDSGSFSYAADDQIQSYLRGTASHNTIQFDGRDQMPKLGRFLFGDWLKPSFVGDLTTSNDCQSWAGSYRDAYGCFHKRTISLLERSWEIDDEIDGYEHMAILRWRLHPDKWQIEKTRCFSDKIELEITSDVRIRRFEIMEGFESRYYFEKTNIPVLEVEFTPKHARLKTRIYLKD